MLIKKESKLNLRSYTIRTRQKNRFFHLLDLCKTEGTGESTQTTENFWTHGSLDELLHQFNRFITSYDINTCALVIHMDLLVLPSLHYQIFFFFRQLKPEASFAYVLYVCQF